MIGRKINVGVGKETSRGTAVAPTYWIPKYEVSIDNKKEYLNNEQSIGVIADSDNSLIVKEWAEGEITGKVRDDSFGLFLLAALGSVSSSLHSGESAVYDHTFSLNNSNQHHSLTVEVKNDNEQLAYPLAVVNSLKINADVGKFVEFAVGFMAKKGVSASNTPSYSIANEFIAKHAVIKFADNLSGLDSADSVSVKSIELSIEKNIEPDEVLGSTEPSDFYNKQFSVEVNLEALFDNTTLKGYYENGTHKAMRIDLINSDTTIGNAANPELKIDLPKVSFQEWERSGGNDDLVTQSLRLKGHYSISDSKIIQAILTNTVTTY